MTSILEVKKVSYKEIRSQIYDSLREENIFTWDFYGENRDEYALATVHLVSDSFIKEISYATAQLGQIFGRTASVVQKGLNRLLNELGLPKETWRSIRLEIDPHLPTVIGRFDFANTPQGLKMIEFNSDTPTAVVEAFYVNEQVCSYFSVENPNKNMFLDLRKAFHHVVQTYQSQGYKTENIYFTAVDWHKEDVGTTKYLLQQSGLPAKYAPLSSLMVWKDQLVIENPESYQHTPVDILYRLYPLEMLATTADRDGYPTGAHILKLIAERKVGVINPPAAFISQTKALQALIWNIHEQRIFFTEEEHEIIEKYMIPTHFDNQFCGKSPYVQKPIFGREGGAVSLFDQNGQLLVKDQAKYYWEQPMIYQEMVELETVTVPTLAGDFTGRLLWGSFLIDGQSSAVVARVDKEITGDNAFYLPVGIKG